MLRTKRPLVYILLAAIVAVAIAALLVPANRAPEYADATPAQKKILDYAAANGLRYSDYPESLIALLERNPETEKFVLEYPVASKNTGDVDLSEFQISETVPLFLQWDQRWGYQKYGSDVAGLTACGPLCLSMAAWYLTQDSAYAPDKMIRFAADNGYYVKGSGSSWTLISEGGVKLGFEVTEIPLDKNRILKNLQVGNPIICVMGPGDFTTTGHYIVLSGCEGELFRVNDPNSIQNSQKLWSYEQLEKQFRNLWVIRK